MKLLFVDDEPRILTGIENALIFADDAWEADFSTSGEEALTAMQAATYDVLVTDMKMPGLTGADVLEYAKANCPSMCRIILSGEVDSGLAERAMPLAHEFVSKPCDPDDLFEIIARVTETSQLLEDTTVRDVLGSLDRLPSQPALLSQIQDCITRGEGVDAIAHVIEADLAVAASVLRTANSAFYGFRTPSETVRDAVSRLGTQTVTGVVLNAEIAAWSCPETADLVAQLNRHSARVAEIVRKLVGRELPQAPLAGLLHDVGMLVLITKFTDEYRLLEEMVAVSGEPGEKIERQIFGASHAEIGAYMLEMWKADPIVVEATRYHHNPEGASDETRRIVEAITAANIAARPETPVPPDMDEDLLARARELYESGEEDE